MRILPEISSKLCYIHGGWIIGSGAKPDCNLETVRDIDIIIPFTNWYQAAQVIPYNASVNTFGGWKFMDGKKEVDVWPDDLGLILTNALATDIWHPRSGARFTKIK